VVCVGRTGGGRRHRHRAIGQLWPYLFLAFAALWVMAFRRRDPGEPGEVTLDSAIMLVMILSCCRQSGTIRRVSLTSNGVRSSWAYLAALAVEIIPAGASIRARRMVREVLVPVDGRDPSEAEVLGRMRSRVTTSCRSTRAGLQNRFSSRCGGT